MLHWVCLASLASLILAVVPLAAPAPASAAEAFTVTQVTVDDSYDRYMVLSGDRIAWEGTGYFGVSSYGADDWEIFTWTPATDIFQVSWNQEDDWAAQVSGDRIVWYGVEMDQYTDRHIMTWTPTTQPTAVSGQYPDAYPSVSGDRVAWDSRGGSDGGTDCEIFTWTPTGGTVQLSSNAFEEHQPKVSGNRIVWYRAGGSDGGVDYELFTWTPAGGVVQLTRDDLNPGAYEVSGDRIIWTQAGGSDSGQDLEVFTWTPTGGTVQLTADNQDVSAPRISGDRIVWDMASDASRVYTWTPTGGVVVITPGSYYGAAPDVSGDRIVWGGRIAGSPSLVWQVFTWTPTAGTTQVTSDTGSKEWLKVSGDRIAWMGSPGLDGGTDNEVFTAALTPPQDLTPPTTTLIASPDTPTFGGWYWASLEVTLRRKNNEAGTTWYSYSSSGTPASTYSEPFTPLEGDRTIYFWSRDAANNTETKKSWSYKLDTTAPTTPGGVSATAAAPGVANVSWSASTDTASGIGRYVVYRDGQVCAYVSAPTTTYQASGLTGGRQYRFNIAATDGAGRESAQSPNVYVTPTIDPAAPGWFSGLVTSGGVGLSGVTVAVGNWSSTSGAGGGYTLTGITPGTYTATYSKVGYVTASAGVTILAGATVTRNVSLTLGNDPPVTPPDDPPVTPPGGLLPVYRFYNLEMGVHFYTASASEMATVRDTLSRTYRLEGVAYSVNTGNSANNTVLYRFYNKKTGTHFYTADPGEKANVENNMRATYAFDGPAYEVSATNVANSTTVWRFYNFRTGTHFYTADPAEKSNVENNMRDTYSLDGPGFYLAP
jgi:Repeat of unknown function (DUF5648)/Carboxypeptidase regulatory-like domain